MLSLLVLLFTGVMGIYNGGEDAFLSSAIAASAGSAAIAAGVIWTVYRFTRKDQPAAPARA